MLIEGIKARWEKANEVDHYGISDLSALVGIGIFMLFTPFSKEVRQALGESIMYEVALSPLGQRIYDINARRFDLNRRFNIVE